MRIDNLPVKSFEILIGTLEHFSYINFCLQNREMYEIFRIKKKKKKKPKTGKLMYYDMIE